MSAALFDPFHDFDSTGYLRNVTVTALDKSGLTREQQVRPESYRPGMVTGKRRGGTGS